MLTVTINDKPPNNWNQNIQKNEFGSVYQTKEFGEYGKKHSCEWDSSTSTCVVGSANVLFSLS